MQTVENGEEILQQLASALGVTDSDKDDFHRRRSELAEYWVNVIFASLSKARQQLAKGDKTMQQMANEVENLEKAGDKILQKIKKYKNKLSK